jgi:hypothetical protein
MRGAGALVAVLLVAAAAAAPAGAQVSGWDGRNPFRCTLQQAGMGTDFEDPAADPFCVEYEKRHQNVTELGIVDFISKEPARVAAAGPKCFYYQHDHWTSRVVQSDESTETYNWDGSYFFDKATGRGGAYVENFTINNQTGDPTQVPGFPPEWKPYFGPGRGGVQTEKSVQADPRCKEQAERDQPFASPDEGRCKDRRGSAAGRRLGAVGLGMTRRQVEGALGPPARTLRGFMRFCLNDGAKLAVGFRGGRAAFVLTTSPGFDVRGARPGDGQRRARRAMRGETLLMRRGITTVLAVGGRARRLLLGIRERRLHYIALASAGLSRGEIADFLTRSR